MSTLVTVWLAPIIVLAASVMEFIVQNRQLRSLREELEGTKAIIKDTADLRKAISRSLEGTWSLLGEFDSFQNNEAPHASEGFLVLTWIPEKSRYEAIYAYSVTRVGTPFSLATTICSGYSDGDLESGNPSFLELYMTVESRTDWENKPNRNRHFTFEARIDYPQTRGHAPRITVEWQTPGTTAKLFFTKVT